MWTCKQVSKALENQHYEDLPLLKRLGLKLHVALCVVCGRYNKQVMLMQDTCHHFKEHTEHAGEHLDDKMDEDSKKKMESLIQDELNKG